jgi:hypothetical protein
MSASGYQSRFDSLTSQGYRPASVESYLHNGQIRYAGIWVKSSGPDYFAFHGYSATDYQNMLNTKTAAGYLPANVSAVSVNGALSYTGLPLKRSLGSWLLKSALSPTDYQTLFTQETKAGLPQRVRLRRLGAVHRAVRVGTEGGLPGEARDDGGRRGQRYRGAGESRVPDRVGGRVRRRRPGPLPGVLVALTAAGFAARLAG